MINYFSHQYKCILYIKYRRSNKKILVKTNKMFPNYGQVSFYLNGRNKTA